MRFQVERERERERGYTTALRVAEWQYQFSNEGNAHSPDHSHQKPRFSSYGTGQWAYTAREEASPPLKSRLSIFFFFSASFPAFLVFFSHFDNATSPQQHHQKEKERLHSVSVSRPYILFYPPSWELNFSFILNHFVSLLSQQLNSSSVSLQMRLGPVTRN